MIGALVSTLVGPISGLLDKFIPDADTKAKLAHEIATMSAKQAHEAAMRRSSCCGTTPTLRPIPAHSPAYRCTHRPAALW